MFLIFLLPEMTDRPMLFEVFTTIANENEAAEKILSIEKNLKGEAKKITKKILGKKNIETIKTIINK